DPDTRVNLVTHVRGAGRAADAVELLEARLREAPDDDEAVEQYGVTLEQAYDHVNEEAPAGSCPCGKSGSDPAAAWTECCAPRERAALMRFSDRSGLIALQDAIGSYLSQSEYGAAVDDQVAESLSLIEDLDWDQAEQAAFGDLMA